MKNPSETTAAILSSGRYKNLDMLLQRALIEKALVRLVRGIELYGVIDPKDPLTEDIPPFLDPVKVNDAWVLDLRSVRNKMSKRGDEYVMPDDGTIGLLKRLTFATMQWESEPDTFTSLGNFGIICFGFWVGNTISNSEGLQIIERNQLIVAAMAWAWCQKNLTDKKQGYVLTSDEENTVTNVISGNVGLERQNILALVRTLGYMSTIGSFVDAIKELDIRRLSRFQTGTLITLVGNSWFGFIDNRYMVASALEYPPYFYSIVYEAIENGRLYKKTAIAGVVENQRNNHTSRSFKNGFKDLVQSLDE